MDRTITNISGVENLLRCRDLPSACRTAVDGNDRKHLPLNYVVFETRQSLRARALILNTFEDLDSLILCQIRSRFPNVFTLGPLHAHLNSRALPKTLSRESPPSSSNNLWEEDRACITWLDSQPTKSVLYVSFGSLTTVTRRDLMEIWHGLVNCKKRFLWVARPNIVAEKDSENEIPMELVEGTKERGFMVGWAPQEEVLAHPAIGGFMTHSGWNSTLESIVAGIPMICWPFFADQQINSRFVSEVWRLGLDMKDVCEREIVEKMVNDLMEDRREEFAKSAENMAALAKKSVSEDGSSYSNFDCLIEFIKSITVGNR